MALVPQNCSLSPSSGSAVFPDTTVEFSGTVLNDGDQAAGYDAMFLVNGSVFENTSVDPIQPNELETTTITFTPGDEGFSAGDTLTYEFDTFFFGGSNPPTISCGTHQLQGDGNGGSDFDPSLVSVQDCTTTPQTVPQDGTFSVSWEWVNDNSVPARVDYDLTVGPVTIGSHIRTLPADGGHSQEVIVEPQADGVPSGTQPVTVNFLASPG